MFHTYRKLEIINLKLEMHVQSINRLHIKAVENEYLNILNIL
jgi:hypothetical protein